MCWPPGRRGRWALPIAKFIVASNRNDILPRFLAANDMSVRGGGAQPVALAWTSRSARNFERLLFEFLGRDAGADRRHDGGFPRHRQHGGARRRLARDPARFHRLHA